MAGFTSSTTMVHPPPPGSEFYQASPSNGANTGYIARIGKLNGVRQWSSFFGTSNLTIHGMVAVSNKKIFITGSTEAELPALDVTAPTGSDYWDYQAGKDGFIAMFNDLDQHAWRTHLPGDADDEAWDIDASDTRLVVAGVTYSTDMNTLSAGSGSYAVGPFGGGDCFVYEYSTNGTLLWGTYAGTISYDFISDNAVAIDPQTKDIVISGRTGFGLDIVEGPGWYQNSVPFGTPASFILRFSGGNRARVWSTYLHNGPGSNTDIRACQFDPNGKLYIAGRVRDGSGVLLQPLSGIYQQNAYNIDLAGTDSEASDPFVICFGPGNVFLWGTYFGGAASAAYHELIYTVLWRILNGNIYVGGYTSKDDDPLSYFPLDDGQGIPYFEELWQGGLTEGFLASFCGDSLNGVGVHDLVDSSGGELIVSWAEEQLVVHGLPAGSLAYQILDAAGRVVQVGRFSSNGHPVRLKLPDLTVGAYLFSGPHGSARFSIAR